MEWLADVIRVEQSELLREFYDASPSRRAAIHIAFEKCELILARIAQCGGSRQVNLLQIAQEQPRKLATFH